MTDSPTIQVAPLGEIFFLRPQQSAYCTRNGKKFLRQTHRGLNSSNMTRDGTDFPFKISSRDLTGCHYCAALSDGSADERAIAIGNRHEKVDQMEARDTRPLEGRRQREEGAMRRSRTSREIVHILGHILFGARLLKKLL